MQVVLQRLEPMGANRMDQELMLAVQSPQNGTEVKVNITNWKDQQKRLTMTKAPR